MITAAIAMLRSRLGLEVLAVLAVLAGLALFVRHERVIGRQEGRAAVQARWDAERHALQLAADQAAQAATIETARREAAQLEIAHEADRFRLQARTDAAGAATAADRLRNRFAAAAAGGCGAAPDSAAAGPGAPASAAGDLLNDVLGRVVEAAQQLAAAADDARGAGLACQRSYDALSARSLGGASGEPPAASQ